MTDNRARAVIEGTLAEIIDDYMDAGTFADRVMGALDDAGLVILDRAHLQQGLDAIVLRAIWAMLRDLPGIVSDGCDRWVADQASPSETREHNE